MAPGRASARFISSVPTKSLPPSTLTIAGLLLALGVLGPNTALSFFAVAVLVTGMALLWRPGESPILIFVFGFQWTQASVKLFYADALMTDVQELADYYGILEKAITLSLVGLLLLAIGIRLGAGRWVPEDGMRTRATALGHDLKTWFKLYAIIFVIGAVAQSFAGVIPGLSQPILAVASLKWAFYWMLAYATFVRGADFKYWLIAFSLELLWAIGAYFSDFKTPLLFTLLAAVAARVRLSPRQFVGLATLAAITLSMGIVWTAIKPDYRLLVSEGKGQVVRVGYLERLATIKDLVFQLDRIALEEAADQLVSRLSYVDFFSVVIKRVPHSMPHENGALWSDAIIRPFMPRLFFPEKTAIHDSVRTNYYTGLNKAGAKEGVSISIGYMGESYIDFGSIGMMVPIFALGFLLGRFYRWMLRMDRSRVFLGMALATATIFTATFLEVSITKLFGGLLVTMLVSWMILRRIAPWFFPSIRTRVA